MFQKAVKRQLKARIAIAGGPGSGKTYSSLAIASGLGKRIALIDTERESARLYADLFNFDTCELSTGHPQNYIDAIEAAGSAGYDVLIIDSLSHAWDGVDGALELVDKATKRSKSRNSFTDGWGEVTPLHRRLIDTILKSPCHVIATMRTKVAYEIEERNGKKVPVKIGLQPIQRFGVEYEFTVTADMDLENNLVVSKTRCPKLKQAVIKEPGKKLGQELLTWLNSGEAIAPSEKPAESNAATAKRSNGASDKRSVWREIQLCREKMGDQDYAEIVGSVDWKPKDLDDARAGLEALQAAVQRQADDAPQWDKTEGS